MDSGIKTKVMGSGAGIAVALVVILLFILAATFLKSLVFGIIAAYFLLPLEKFFENRIFQSRAVMRISGFLSFLFSPFTRLRDKLMRTRGSLPPGRIEQEKREKLVLKSTLSAFLTCVIAVFFVFAVTASFIIPAAIDAGRSINAWASESSVLKHAESKVTKWINKGKEEPEPAEKKAVPSAESGSGRLEEQTLGALFEKLRPQIRKYIDENGSDVAMFAFSKGKGIIASLFSLASYLGTFAFDILLFVFFFLFFIQKMAMFSDAGGKSNVGEWCVQGLFNTAWLPATSDEARSEAAGIINTISNMFNRWVRGYISIIIIETVIYLILFSLFSVPYAIPLAMLAGLTILLPFIGPVASFVLTFGVCIGFCDSHLVVTLIGVAAAYCVVNGILEQLILYPSFVGGAIGLSTVETIIVVLIGGLMAGITGMILAVPAAAVIKYLIPKIYELRRVKTELPDSPGR